MRAVYEAVRRQHRACSTATVPGGRRLRDPEHRSRGRAALRAAVTDAGYALYAAKLDWDDDRPAGQVLVREVVAATAEARAGLWGFLLGLDLMRTLSWELAPSDHPLPHLLANAQDVRLRGADGLCVRLVDVPRALAAAATASRSRSSSSSTTRSARGTAAAGRCAGTAPSPTCARTDAARGPRARRRASWAPPTSAARRSTRSPAPAGRAELRAGALAAASRGFHGERAPWCPEIF